jgi:hypothetical protein
MILVKMLFRQQRCLGMTIGFSKVEGTTDWNRIDLYRNYSNSHIRTWIIVKCFNQIWEWCYWIACSNTRSLQLESFKNKFLNSRYGQNGDLRRFECTKCVHVSSLDFLDPMVFYRTRAFQRLQNCNFWIPGSIDMN